MDRLVYALVNEGARLLGEGIAAPASDIDVVYLTGYGFPRIRHFAADPHGDPEFWTPAPLLERLAKTSSVRA